MVIDLPYLWKSFEKDIVYVTLTHAILLNDSKVAIYTIKLLILFFFLFEILPFSNKSIHSYLPDFTSRIPYKNLANEEILNLLNLAIEPGGKPFGSDCVFCKNKSENIKSALVLCSHGSFNNTFFVNCDAYKMCK